jgi:hypothetical protein
LRRDEAPDLDQRGPAGRINYGETPPDWGGAADRHGARRPDPVAETGEVVVTTPRIPGLELRLPPGTVIRDRDGAIVREISITPIPVIARRSRSRRAWRCRPTSMQSAEDEIAYTYDAPTG